MLAIWHRLDFPTCFSHDLSKIFLYLRPRCSRLSCPFQPSARFTRREIDSGAGRKILGAWRAPKFWVLIAPRIFRGGGKGINGPNPKQSCSATCWCNACTRTTGRMFNWAFGRARPNANVSHNPAYQLTLLETSSAPARTDRQRSTINPIIDCESTHVRRPITKIRRLGDYLARAYRHYRAWKLLRIT